MLVVLFEDDSYDELSPLIEYRPAFFLKIGAFSLWEYLQIHFPQEKLVSFSERELIAEKYELAFDHEIIRGKPVLFLNGRILPEMENLLVLKKILGQKGELALFDEQNDEQNNKQKKLVLLKTQRVDFAVKLATLLGKAREIQKRALKNKSESKNAGKNEKQKHSLKTLSNVFELPKLNALLLPQHLKIQVQKHHEIMPHVYSDLPLKLADNLALDTSAGAIFIASDAVIEPWVHLKGPLWISEKCLIKSHSQIEKSYLGKQVKLSGEVINVLVYPYSNKSHHGFLGDSVIGSWVNLGAGATTSNLKNTYGDVKGYLLNSGEKIITGENRIGTIMGDFAKIAINSTILTGKLVGFGASVMGLIKGNVAPFRFYIDLEKHSVWTLPSFLRMTEKMFERRNIKLSTQEIALITNIFHQFVLQN